MHPRNIYKTPPDFSKLVVKYPEFSKIATIDLNGVVRIDFKDLNSLRILTKCLLHSDFNLIVDIPENKLIPTVPLRLNYLLWIEDLLNFFEIKDNIKGIDIGTGSSCIYPLLGSKQFQWRMLGTEVDEESFKFAVKNIKENKLDDYITVKKTTPDGNLIIDCLNGEFSSVDFSMCNPPFFSSFDEIDNAISLSRAPPNNAQSGSSNEIVTHGGETTFIYKLIKESLESRDSVKIYTTMLGHKSSLKTLRKFIHEFGITQFTQTTFVQGKTTRWGLAWSFSKNLKLFKDSQPKKEKKGKPISFIIPQMDPSNYTVSTATKKILEILNTIEIKCKVFEKSESICTMEIVANNNKWSHQRRKRRQVNNIPDDEQKKLNTTSTSINETESDDITMKNAKKRKLDSFEDDNIKTAHKDDPKADQLKKIDMDQTNVEQRNTNDSSDSRSDCNEDKSIYLKAALCLRKHEDFLLLEIAYMSGACGKDGVNQVVQFIKNNWI